jgi:hypothetical protein
MKISELRKILPEIMKAGEVPMLVGHAGVGKTQAIKEIGRKFKRDVIILSLSQMEPGDLIGMPSRDGNKTVWLQPEWWPQHGNSIIFLDEINRSHETVRAAIMQLLLDKRLNTHVLPEGTWIAAAMNPETDSYEVEFTIDQAYIDRFVWLKVTNDFEEWTKYMSKKKDIDSRYLEALKNVFEIEPTVFQMNETFDLPNIVPTPRAHERAAKLYSALPKDIWNEYGFEILRGVIGAQYAGALIRQLEELQKAPLNLDDLLNGNVEKIKKAKTQDRINLMRLFSNFLKETADPILFKKINIDALMKSLKAFKSEEVGVLVREAYNDEELANKLKKLQDEYEVFADFIIRIVSGSNSEDIDLDTLDKLI